MGYQNGNDNGQMQSNVDRNNTSSQRTTNVERLSKNTSQSQYGRLNMSNAVDTRYDDKENYNCSPRTVDNQVECQRAVGRTSYTESLSKNQVSGSDDRLKGSGKPVGTGE